uniref:Uncharacterized protein n=1 Tax=Glossina pallidipes TaxID=7398 RepID=A0A1A9ZVB3_GLOPL
MSRNFEVDFPKGQSEGSHGMNYTELFNMSADKIHDLVTSRQPKEAARVVVPSRSVVMSYATL